MTIHSISKTLGFSVMVLLLLSVFSPSASAQGPLPSSPDTASAVTPAPSTFATVASTKTDGEHKFWDTKNRTLFVAVGALNVADFALTRSNLQNGGKELNPLVRAFGTSTPGLAANFAGQTLGVIGLSYMFHKTGHHKLERITSFVSASTSFSAVTFDMAHR
jgi:hypothetical protein